MHSRKKIKKNIVLEMKSGLKEFVGQIKTIQVRIQGQV